MADVALLLTVVLMPVSVCLLGPGVGGKDDIVDSLEGGCLEWPGVATLVPILAESLLEAPDLRNQN